MPNRILKESICTSENIAALTFFEEVFFFHLMVNADDFGRFDARPKILKARLFPLKDIRENQIEDAIRALTAAELVIPYRVEGKPFLQLKTWDRHQRMRNKKGKYPAPCEDLLQSAANCGELPQVAENASESRPESESELELESESELELESESETETNAHARAREDVQTRKERDFDRFWSAYPKKVGKGDARKAFAKIKDVPVETMIDAIEQQKQSNQWRRDGGQYIPNPATWLNREDWTAQLQADILPPIPPPRQNTNPFLELLQEEEQGGPANDQT